MTEQAIFDSLKQALDETPRNQYTTEMHLQMIKYADDLDSIQRKNFAKASA